MIVITDRDKEIKEFLEDVEVADTKTIHQIFFNGTCIRNCQKRLKQLTNIRFIKSYRENTISQNIYYAKNKPKNWKHKIVFSQLLGVLHQKGIEVLKYRTPFIIDNIANKVISDGLIITRVDEQVDIFFIEVELTKKPNYKKYEDLYYSRKYLEKFPIMPTILVVTDKRINTNHKVLNIKSCKLNFSNLDIGTKEKAL